MNDKVYTHLRKRYNEIYSVEPNTLYIPYLDGMYKWATRHLKTFPFKVIIPVSTIGALVLYILLGGLTIHLVSLLQYGF